MCDPISAAIGGAGVGLLGIGADNKNQKKGREMQERQRAESLKYIQEQVAKTQGQLFQLFPQAQQSRQQAMLAGTDLFKQAFPAQMEAFQGGNMMAQQALLAGLPQANNAILGRPMDLSGLQAQRVPVSAQALQGLFNPQAPQMALISVEGM